MKLWLKYLITFGVGAIITLSIFFYKELWIQTDSKEIIKILSDGFSISGFLLASFGALCFCSSQGAFYGLTYMFHVLFTTHNWSSTKFKDRKSYADYIQEKKEKALPAPIYILLTGIFFIIVGVVFMIIFNI